MYISMAVGTLCMASAGVVYLEVAKQQREGLSSAVLGGSVDLLQDRLIQTIQTMSATQGATLGNPSTNNASKFQLAILSTGPGQPQQQLYFDSAQGGLILDPNKNVSGDHKVIWRSEANAVVLEEMYFTLGLKEGYRPDGSLLNVYLKLNDDKASRRRSGQGYTTTTYERYFTVRLRGP